MFSKSRNKILKKLPYHCDLEDISKNPSRNRRCDTISDPISDLNQQCSRSHLLSIRQNRFFLDSQFLMNRTKCCLVRKEQSLVISNRRMHTHICYSTFAVNCLASGTTTPIVFVINRMMLALLCHAIEIAKLVHISVLHPVTIGI